MGKSSLKVQKIQRTKLARNGGIRTTRGCADNIFNVKIIIEKMLAKQMNVYAASMNLEKA